MERWGRAFILELWIRRQWRIDIPSQGFMSSWMSSMGPSWVSNIDLRSGYHQIWMREEDLPKTTFRCHYGYFEFVAIPFGLTNSLATFQSCMKNIFHKKIHKFVLFLFDDILNYSKTSKEHLHHLEEVLNILHYQYLFSKLSKCEFGLTELLYLGHIIGKYCVKVYMEKIIVIF